MLREITNGCECMSGATFPKFPRSSYRYNGWRSHKKCCSTGTGSQKECRVWTAGIQWFLRKFNADLCKKLSAFKAARIMCPEAMQWLRPAPATVQGLPLFPFLDGNHVINGLITELPNYVAAAHNFTMACEEDKVNWWRQHSDRSPHWSFAVMKVILVQPSSAAAERIFSIINSSFNDSQDHAPVDYIQACVMLQYNKR